MAIILALHAKDPSSILGASTYFLIITIIFMKKYFFITLVALATLGISCTGNSSRATSTADSITTVIDSVSSDSIAVDSVNCVVLNDSIQ